MNKNESFQLELLTKLFLRLNGYFTTSFIIPSPKHGDIKGEIDIIGIRFPFHSQLEREVKESKILEIEDGFIDIIVAEVKASTTKFNSPLSEECKNTKENWEKILKWIGLFTDPEINLVKTDLSNITEDKCNTRNIHNLQKVRIDDKKINIKPTLFVYKDSDYLSKIDFKVIKINDVFDYCKECLYSDVKRDECATTYDIKSWGEFEKIVNYFKDKRVKAPWDLSDFFSKIKMQN